MTHASCLFLRIVTYALWSRTVIVYAFMEIILLQFYFIQFFLLFIVYLEALDVTFAGLQTARFVVKNRKNNEVTILLLLPKAD